MFSYLLFLAYFCCENLVSNHQRLLLQPYPSSQFLSFLLIFVLWLRCVFESVCTLHLYPLLSSNRWNNFETAQAVAGGRLPWCFLVPQTPSFRSASLPWVQCHGCGWVVLGYDQYFFLTHFVAVWEQSTFWTGTRRMRTLLNKRNCMNHFLPAANPWISKTELEHGYFLAEHQLSKDPLGKIFPAQVVEDPSLRSNALESL